MRRPKGGRRPTKANANAKTKPEAQKPPARARRAEYLTPTELADRLLVATVTVRLWANKGLLPSVTTLGSHRRFRVQDVDAFVARHQQTKADYRDLPPRVLIIDDDRQFSHYLAGVIATHAAGVVVEVAHDGFSAGIKCESIRPDVVTLDLQMPDMDSFEVCAMMRSMFGNSKPKILALTGSASAANVERIVAAGADACLSKATSAEVLLLEMGLTHALKF